MLNNKRAKAREEEIREVELGDGRVLGSKLGMRELREVGAKKEREI